MAHYAYLDANNIVTNVIVGRNEDEIVEGISDWETYYGALRTSYHGNIRGNFAGIGYQYFVNEDLFMPPKCHLEAILNIETAKWDCENEDHNVIFN